MVPALFTALPSAKVGANYTHEERPILGIRKIVVKGSVDVFFRRFSTPQLVVAGETQEAIDAIKTRVKGDKLIIESLTVVVAGSGDVDCSDLTANRASLSVAGSGDIEAFVRQSVTAQVVGSGDILVRGNPAQRTKQVVGSGGVKFK
jgi:hypothetical protein